MSIRFSPILNQITSSLKKQGVSEKDAVQIEKELKERIDNEPEPKIAFIGFSGVGKSSTLNALFNAGQEISHVKACTQQEKEIYGDYSQYFGSKGVVRVWDMPGIGEDIYADKRHMEVYKKVIPNVDVVVWTIQADYRAMTPVQRAILDLKKELGSVFIDKLMFAINKADTIDPGETAWNTTFNAPSKEQRENLKEFEKYVKSKILQIIPDWNGSIVSYSAKQRFRLDILLTEMIKTSGSLRQWLLPSVADVASPLDLIDPEWKPYVEYELKRKLNNRDNKR